MVDSPGGLAYHPFEYRRVTAIEPEHAKRLKEIEARIAKLKGPDRPAAVEEDHHSQAQLGWRMVTELVAGLLIGFGIGMGLDAVFGTRPIFMVLFLFAGLAAGVRVMLRTARSFQGDA